MLPSSDYVSYPIPLLGGGVQIDQSELFSRLPPNPFVMVHYKTSHMKVLKFLRKKTPNRPNFFLDFPIIGPKNVGVNLNYGYLNLSEKNTKPIKNIARIAKLP